jgi:hypothetical protein
MTQVKCVLKLYIFIHNEVRDFDKNSTQPEIRVSRVRDNEKKMYILPQGSVYIDDCEKYTTEAFYLLIYLSEINFH